MNEANRWLLVDPTDAKTEIQACGDAIVGSFDSDGPDIHFIGNQTGSVPQRILESMTACRYLFMTIGGYRVFLPLQ